MSDPFETLAQPPEPQTPRPRFARELRARLAAELGLDEAASIPTVDLPERKSAMPTTPTTTSTTTTTTTRTDGGVWAGVSYVDALGGIRFLVDVFGFEEQLVVLDDDGRSVVHSELRWTEGGIVQVGTYDPDNVFMQAPGAQALYLITNDPHAVWARCQAAGLEVVREPESPHYDPEGMGFSVRDHEGNIWSVGSYGGP